MKTCKQLIWMVSAVIIAASCSFDDTEWNAQQARRNTVRFALTIPGVATPTASTRSLTESQESAVSSVDVLVFYTEGTHAGKLYSHEKGKNISPLNFEIELPEGTYDLVVVGNATTILDNTTGLVPQSVTKEAAVASLLHTNTGPWNIQTIPMWGYVNDVTIDESTSLTGSNAIDMHRMVSKVEVQLSTAAAGAGNSNFELTSVRLYNYNTKGRLAPDMSNWNPVGGVINAGKGIATVPTLPADRGAVVGVNNPLIFNASHGLTANHLLNTIYTFEATNGTQSTLTTNPCLVIGGRYQGGSETFYRVDFIKKVPDEEDVYLNLLRNHRYLFNINSVTGTGKETPEDSFNGGSINMEANVLQWEEGEITGFTFDGQNYLGVSQDEFEFTSDPRTPANTDNKLKIRTDVPTGWTATVSGNLAGTVSVPNDGVTGNPWLRISPTSGTGADDINNVMILSTDRNDSGADRTAYVHIQAGRLTYVVKVTQSIPKLKVMDFVTGEEITSIFFPSTTSQLGIAPYSRQVLVEWSPATEDVSVSKTPGLTWSSECPSTLRNGSYVFTINPPGITQDEVDNDPLINKSTRLTFTLGSIANTKTLDIVQEHYALHASNFKNATPDALSHNGLVKSNAPWSVSWTTNLSAGSMTLPTDQPITGVANTMGTSFPYTFTSNAKGEVTFTFTPTDPAKAFDPVTVTVNAVQLPSADPNLITDGGNATAIYTYVGAFWRANQRGERLIRIPTTNAVYAGDWAVQVLDYGDDFKPGDIVFEAGESADPTADAETQLLTSTDPYALGTATTASGIRFRMGLTTQWNSSNPDYNASRPVRYARVVVSFGNNNYQYNRVLFIRQGEAPDYLYHPTDRPTVNTTVRRFSAFNLTTPQFRNPETSESTNYIALPYGTGEFVEYPSQSGALFQYTARDKAAYPNPFVWHPTLASYGWWSAQCLQNEDWSTLEPYSEGCPKGYSDGNNYARPSTLEVASSLALSDEYANATVFNMKKLTGYYADGYFDRREIQSPVGYDPWANSAVNKDSFTAGYSGRLIFNNITNSARKNASLFLPHAGCRNAGNGGLNFPGRVGLYWTTVGAANVASAIRSDHTGNVDIVAVVRPNGYSIRCVVQE